MPKEILADVRERRAAREQLEEVVDQLKGAHSLLVNIIDEMEEEEEEANGR